MTMTNNNNIKSDRRLRRRSRYSSLSSINNAIVWALLATILTSYHHCCFSSASDVVQEVETDVDGNTRTIVSSTTTTTSGGVSSGSGGSAGAGGGGGTHLNRLTQEEMKCKATFDNKSDYRIDLYYDDGKYGSHISIIEKNSKSSTINTFIGHKFFITRHGTKEGLFNPETDEQLKYTINKRNEIEFTIPKNASPPSNPCQDRFTMCSTQLKNQCMASPGWMIVHCCKTCDEELDASRLIDPNVRCTREQLGMDKAGPAWVKDDLNKLFTSWADDDVYKKYEPNVISSPDYEKYGLEKEGPWVITFDNFLTNEEADALIKGGKQIGFERSTDQGAKNALGEQEKIISKTRTSANAWCTGSCEALPEVKSATTKIENITGIPRKNYESFQILEYEHNEFYRMHHDSSGRDTTLAGPRILTFFLYLSDVEEGGETHFNKLDISVKPKKGRALIWPSVTNDDPTYWDNRMYHEAKDVIKGKKYAANHWIHLYDYETPNFWGCTGSFS